MCNSVESETLNALLLGNEGAPTLILQYNGYLNWGRWNHNTSRIRLLTDYLVKELGFNVQLNHDDVENRNCDGYVVIFSPDGVEMYRSDNFQRNPFSRYKLSKIEAFKNEQGPIFENLQVDG